MKTGVYRIRHKKSGAAYIGASVDITNRFTHHRFRLRRGMHCERLQYIFDKYGEDSLVFEILMLCSRSQLHRNEMACMKKERRLLNIVAPGRKHRHSEESRERMRLSRARYLETPGARESLSERAKKQHANGNFGRATWKNPNRTWKMTDEQKERAAIRLRSHIASQSSEEMSRRSYMRKIFR